MKAVIWVNTIHKVLYNYSTSCLQIQDISFHLYKCTEFALNTANNCRSSIPFHENITLWSLGGMQPHLIKIANTRLHWIKAHLSCSLRTLQTHLDEVVHVLFHAREIFLSWSLVTCKTACQDCILGLFTQSEK